MGKAVAASLVVLACGGWLAGCQDQITVDPVGYSSFFIENRLAEAVQVEVTFHPGVIVQGWSGGVIPPTQSVDLGTYGSFTPPEPHRVITSITVRRSGQPAAEAVVAYRSSGEDQTETEDLRFWQKTVRRAEYPSEFEYRLVLEDDSLLR